MLADDIISLLSDEKSSLSEVLLKTKVFLYQIGKKELAEWINHELNGYPDAISLPSYRVIEARIMGDLLNNGWSASGQFLPTYHLESRRPSILCVRGFWDLGARGFVWLFHRPTTDTFANAV
jgi:hypothetical protein